MKGNRLNNQQKLKCALIWFMQAMLLAKGPSKKMDSDQIKMAADLEFFEGYSWEKKSFNPTLSYLKKKTDLTKQKEILSRGIMHRTRYLTFPGRFWFGYMRPFLI
ncbi:hypothetical protein P3L10_018390 [Capsicum annuum]